MNSQLWFDYCLLKYFFGNHLIFTKYCLRINIDLQIIIEYFIYVTENMNRYVATGNTSVSHVHRNV